MNTDTQATILVAEEDDSTRMFLEDNVLPSPLTVIGRRKGSRPGVRNLGDA
jgi:hypothetical protein